MQFSSLFFDLDDTLYPAESGLKEAIRLRMNRFMTERMELSGEEAGFLRRHYFETYGTTLRGLQLHHDVDAEGYLAYVHDLPLKSYLKSDPRLKKLVRSLPQKKWVFTNADLAHARRVLVELDLADCFDGVIDVKATGFSCKPQTEAYRCALALSNETDPSRCVMLDDSPRNLAPAREMGICTILVGTEQPNPAADFSIRTIHDLPRVMPELWNYSGDTVPEH